MLRLTVGALSYTLTLRQNSSPVYKPWLLQRINLVNKIYLVVIKDLLVFEMFQIYILITFSDYFVRKYVELNKYHMKELIKSIYIEN